MEHKKCWSREASFASVMVLRSADGLRIEGLSQDFRVGGPSCKAGAVWRQGAFCFWVWVVGSGLYGLQKAKSLGDQDQVRTRSPCFYYLLEI